MIKSVAAAAAVLALTVAAAPAEASTYVATRSVANGSLSLSITTDGTLGALSAANITSWTVGVTLPGRSFGVSSASGTAFASVQGGAFTATATDLLFDFGAASASYVVLADGATGGWCVQSTATACNSGVGTGETIAALFPVEVEFAPRAGVQVLASAAPVPEPATWAVMIGGFGLAGAALRRRRAPAPA